MLKRRWIIQLLSALGLNSYFRAFLNGSWLYQGPLKKVTVPVLNCYASPSAIFSCPAGSLQHFSAVRLIPYFILGITILPALAVGRLFCGWVCPFGFLQDLMDKLGRKLGIRRVGLPKFLSYFKYGFLVIGVFILPFLTMEQTFCKICPQGTFQGGIPQVLFSSDLRSLVGSLYWTKIGLLVAFLLSFLLHL